MNKPTPPELGSRKRKLFDYLLNGNAVTSRMAIQFEITGGFHKRMQEMRTMHGLNIQTTWVKNPNTGTRYQEYRHIPTPVKQQGLFDNTTKEAA